MKLGALDATVHQDKAREYQVQGYPTIKYFAAGKKSRSSAESYEGGRTSGDIVNFALDKLAESMPPPEIKQVRFLNFLYTKSNLQQIIACSNWSYMVTNLKQDAQL